jgi:hypothetical protein
MARHITYTSRFDPGLEYLIANSGLVGRHILRFGRMLYFVKDSIQQAPAESCAREDRPCRMFYLQLAGWIGALIMFLFTYYIGGSLTRSDQLTLARMNGLGIERAYQLTLFNAMLFGIPCALFYLFMGEGLRWVGDLHSLAAIPAWVGRHAAQLVGLTSFVVDLFRAVDAGWRKRCWAPFGLFPFLINLPTYLKNAFSKI